MKAMYWLNENLEPVVMNCCYVTMIILVFLQVVLRFGFESQISWGTSVAIYMFIWVAWMGASYNVRKRSHLTFGVIRGSLPYKAQFACLLMDAFLWVSMSAVVIYFSIAQVQALKDNFAFVPGSFDMMQWWFYTISPIGWGLIIFRALQNLWEDVRTFQRGEPFVLSGGIISE
jgi:TRAP-type C4-dicarboxylate transport system permease small subunit